MAPVTLVFRAHALERMFERRFNEDDVRQVVEGGKIIESYPGDTPYPSRLILGWRGYVLFMSLPRTTRPTVLLSSDGV